MDALTLVITILQLLCGLAVIVIVLFQSGKSAGPVSYTHLTLPTTERV